MHARQHSDGVSGQAQLMLSGVLWIVLQDDEVREGLKEYSDWPTYPQLFVGGELVGGADIIAELASTQELAEAVGVA